MTNLAEMLENDPVIRNIVRAEGRITKWPENQTGVPSCKSLVCNCRALELVAAWWIPQSALPATFGIHLIRNQDKCWNNHAANNYGKPVLICSKNIG